jgi:hypothetical protein
MRVDEDHSPVSEEQRQQVLNWGEIRVSFRFVSDIERIQMSEMPQISYDEPDGFSEKAVHKARVDGDTPGQYAGLSAPKEMDNGTISQVRTIAGEPFASFVFKYRSTSKFPSQHSVSPLPTIPLF